MDDTLRTTNVITCALKTPFDSRDAAKRKLKRIRKSEKNKPKRRRSRKIPVRAYECNMCGKWHLTSQPLQQ